MIERQEVIDTGQKDTRSQTRWRLDEGKAAWIWSPWGGLCWLVLDMGPCFISSDRRDAWHSAAKQGEMVLTNKTWWVDDEQK